MTAFNKGFLGFPHPTLLQGPYTLLALAAPCLRMHFPISQEFEKYEIDLVHVAPTVDASNLLLYGSIDGGANVFSTNENYHVRISSATNLPTTVVGAGATASTEIGIAASVGNANFESLSGTIKLYRRAGTRASLKWEVIYVDSAGNIVQSSGGGLIAVSEINTLRLVWNTGEFAAGYAKLRAYKA